MGDILFLAHRVPYPPNRGDKIRGFHLLKYLSARANVHLVAFADDARDLAPSTGLTDMTCSRSVTWRAKSRVSATLQALAGRTAVSISAFQDRALHAAVRKVLAIEAIDTIYVFSSQMAQYLPPTPRQRVIMDFVDMDSAKFAAYSEASRGPLRWLMKREARLLLAFERKIAAHADVSLFVSQAEADLFRDATGIANVRAIENGIDTDFFDPSQMFEPIVSNGRLIVFTGQMDYRPNVEAVTRFAQHILPIVRREHRDVQFAIVGRSPSAEVIALAGLEGVTVTGEVADVRGWLAAASVVVAPLLLARGVQNKVLEAMAMARPVVASRAAAEGIDHADTIRVGTTAAELAAEVIAVLDDPREAAVLGHAARLQVQQRYGWDARLAPLDALLRVSPAVLPRTAAA